MPRPKTYTKRHYSPHWGNYKKRGRPPKDYKPPIEPILKSIRRPDKPFIITFD